MEALKDSSYEGNIIDTVAIVGLGYVGLPLAVAFSKKISVIGFDTNVQKIELYKKGIDVTKEVGGEALKSSNIAFTSDPAELRKAQFIIVAVPTPVDSQNNPDFQIIESASRLVGQNLAPYSTVVFESTVYPGATEEICLPILEAESGMKCGNDFKIGYSPERINPGDKVHRLETITKIVAGIDKESLELISQVYSLVVDVGVYRASSIKIAEAAKVIENAQRDINIAFVNELSMIFHKMDIDTLEVLEAAKTKWNFLGFNPGLVGGHCIGVDPYYLTYKAEQMGYRPEVILSGRRINDNMGKYIAENVIKSLIKANVQVGQAKVAILGFTFKENCPDTRNTRVIDIVHELNEYGISPLIADPVADEQEAHHEYGVTFETIEAIRDVDAVILAVGHEEFKTLSKQDLDRLYGTQDSHQKVLFDVKGILNKEDYQTEEYSYWRL